MYIVKLKDDGSLDKVITCNIYQGMNNVVKFVAVSRIEGIATIRFTLPTGVLTLPQEMYEVALDELPLGIASSEEYAWGYTLPIALTANLGEVYYQIVYSCGEDIIFTTVRGSFFISEGAGSMDIGFEPIEKDLALTSWSEVLTRLANIEDGAEVNIIEDVKINGTSLSKDSLRAVDIAVPTNVSNGAQVNTIEAVKVNGVTLVPDTNKGVDIIIDIPNVDVVVPVLTEGVLINIANTPENESIDIKLYGSTIRESGISTPTDPKELTSVDSSINIIASGINLINLKETSQATVRYLTYRIANQTLYANKDGIDYALDTRMLVTANDVLVRQVAQDFNNEPVIYPAGIYRLSIKNKTGNGHSTYYPEIKLLLEDNTYSSSLYFPNTTTSKSITTTLGIKGVILNFFGGNSIYDLSFNLQLEMGSVETEYAPYSAFTNTIPLKNTNGELLNFRSVTSADGIFSINDEIYKDADGKWYLMKKVQENVYNGVNEGSNFWVLNESTGELCTNNLTPAAKSNSLSITNLYDVEYNLSGNLYQVSSISGIITINDWLEAIATTNLHMIYELESYEKIELHQDAVIALNSIQTKLCGTNFTTRQENGVQPIINVEQTILGEKVGYIALKDKLGNTLAPFTKADNVFFNDGMTLEQKFALLG